MIKIRIRLISFDRTKVIEDGELSAYTHQEAYEIIKSFTSINWLSGYIKFDIKEN